MPKDIMGGSFVEFKLRFRKIALREVFLYHNQQNLHLKYPWALPKIEIKFSLLKKGPSNM